MTDKEYVVPDVWKMKQVDNKFSAVNRPSAGARFEAELPKGEFSIQLYSLGTPNGQKVTILLEELGIDYDAWNISIMQQEQFSSGFVAVNPNSKIPAMLDYSLSPPLRVFESASILQYLAEKEKRFLPTDIRKRTECLNWLFWIQGVAPYIGGGFGHFYKYAGQKIEYCIDRFSMETKRIVDVLDKQLQDKQFVIGDDYTIADMAIMPWMNCLSEGYGAAKFLSLHEYKNMNAWLERLKQRPAVQRGMRVNGFGADAVKERHSPKDFESKL